MVEVTALALAHITDPVALKMIAVTFCQHTVAIALSLVPLTFVNVFIRVNHTTFTLGQAIDPVAIVTIAILVKEGASSVFFIFVPVTCVLTTKLFAFSFPVCTLAMALINGPHALVLVMISVELDTEAFFAVVTPVTNIFL